MWKKRGSSQIDWAVSLALFLLYLAWFFIYMKPAFDQPTDMMDELQAVRDKFDEKVSLEVGKRPIIIDSKIQEEDFPFYVRQFSDNFAFADDRPYSLFDGKVFFLEDTEKKKDVVWLVESKASYDYPSYISGIRVNGTTVEASAVKADFGEDSIQFLYNNKVRIGEFVLRIGSTEIVPKDEQSLKRGIMYYNKKITDSFNYTFMIFDKSNVVMNLFDHNTNILDDDYNITYDMRLFGYDRYFGNNLYQGQINYTDLECERFYSDFVMFYKKGGDAVSINLQEVGEVSFCSGEDDVRYLDVEIEFPHERSVENYFIFHEADNVSEYVQLPVVKTGVPEIMKGYEAGKVEDIFRKNYANLKLEWSIENDFAINLTTDDEDFAYSPEKMPEAGNIYVKKSRCQMIDKFAKITDCDINVRIW